MEARAPEFDSPPCLFEPVRTIRQLQGHSFTHIIGCGLTGSYVLSQLDPAVRGRIVFVDLNLRGTFDGRPVIDWRTFAATTDADSPVIHCSDDPRTVALLVALGHRRVLWASALMRSRRALMPKPTRQTTPMAILSTVPRSGTHRIMYLFYALNEILRNLGRVPSPHKLYQYHVSNRISAETHSSLRGSPYRLAELFDLLGVEEFSWGHFIPPGSLATFGDQSEISAMLSERWMSYAEASRAHAELGRMSHDFSSGYEPLQAYEKRYQTRYALVARGLLDQLTSQVTIYELMKQSIEQLGGREWPLARYVEHLRQQPFGYWVNYQLPLILRQAVLERQSVADIVLREPHRTTLVFEYALPLHAATHFERHPTESLRARVFSYEAMMQDESRFFHDLITFLRGGRQLDEAIREKIEQARRLSGESASIEASLGHSLNYADDARNPIQQDSHRTDVPGGQSDRRRVRASVRAALEAHETQLKATLDGLLRRMESTSRPVGQAGHNAHG